MSKLWLCSGKAVQEGMPGKRASSFRLVSASGLDFCFLKEMFLFENRDSMPLASQAVQG